MGLFPVCALYGGLENKSFHVPVNEWKPISTEATIEKSPQDAVPLPFKIGGLVLPMLNHNATYDEAVRALVLTIESYYADASGFFPIVSCGETCDALGYGSDILDVLTEEGKRHGFYFTHKSGENNKCSRSRKL